MGKEIKINLSIKNWTLVVLGIALVALIGYDIYAMIVGGSDATISFIVWTGSKNYPVIPFAIGVLCGHLFWSQQPEL